MTGLVRRATLITAAGLLAATAAMAGVPSATTSSQPSNPTTVVVELSGGVPNVTPTGAQFSYTIRDAANNPVPGSVVICNFSACNDTRLSSTQAAGITANCAAKTVTGVTNASGQITFVVAGNARTGAGSALGACMTVTADGVPMASRNVACPDGDMPPNGMNLLDVSASAGDFFTTPTRLRFDVAAPFGTMSLLDVSQVAGYAFSGPWPPAPGFAGAGTDVPGPACSP